MYLPVLMMTDHAISSKENCRIREVFFWFYVFNGVFEVICLFMSVIDAYEKDGLKCYTGMVLVCVTSVHDKCVFNSSFLCSVVRTGFQYYPSCSMIGHVRAPSSCLW